MHKLRYFLMLLLFLSCATKSKDTSSNSAAANNNTQTATDNNTTDNSQASQARVNPNSQVSDASVTIKLINEIPTVSDPNIATIFDDPVDETNFAQNIIQFSDMRRHFSNILPYTTENSDYLIEITTLRYLEPRTLNRTFYEKSYILNFRLIFQQKATPNDLPTNTYIVSQLPLKIPFNRNIDEVYVAGLNEFLAVTRSNRYYKTATQIYGQKVDKQNTAE